MNEHRNMDEKSSIYMNELIRYC